MTKILSKFYFQEKSQHKLSEDNPRKKYIKEIVKGEEKNMKNKFENVCDFVDDGVVLLFVFWMMRLGR
jgi:hypothetical protein